MKLLFDQNLSRRLVERLADVYPGAAHVVLLGLDRESDSTIRDYAAREGFTVVTKDADFDEMAIVLGPPPKLILIRLGQLQRRRGGGAAQAGSRRHPRAPCRSDAAVLALPVQVLK